MSAYKVKWIIFLCLVVVTVWFLLEKKPCKTVVSDRIEPKWNCVEYEQISRQETRGKYMIFRNFIKPSVQFKCNEAVTFCTHADVVYLQHLERLTKRFDGPISLAVYAPGTDFSIAMKLILYMRKCKSRTIWRLVTFHVFFDMEHMPKIVNKPLLQAFGTHITCSNPPIDIKQYRSYRSIANLDYPMNLARNIAKEEASTHFLMSVDIELIPSREFSKNFIKMIDTKPGIVKRFEPAVYVLPTFEILRNTTIPDNKKHLEELTEAKRVHVFLEKICPECFKIPDFEYPAWFRRDTSGYIGIYMAKKKRKHWTPFFVGTKSDPFFDERFVWGNYGDRLTQVLEDLNQRLTTSRPLTPPLEGVQNQYGVNTKLLQEFIDYWLSKYDWRKQEALLNAYPQFKTNIQGLDIHFARVRPKNPNNLRVVPLVLFHGWPSSFREFYDVIPKLMQERKDEFVFELIVPSLPGFGFSDGVSKPGFSVLDMAVVFKNFMERLELREYYLIGTDWGGLVVQHMATLYPQNVLGVYSTMCVSQTLWDTLKYGFGSIYPPMVVTKDHEHKMYPVPKILEQFLEETGYMHVQSTKPDTIGVALNDSPIGLASYILQLFISFTNPNLKHLEDGGLSKYRKEQLLDNIMIYWVTRTITTSMRTYAETVTSMKDLQVARNPINVPCACARFAYEIIYRPDNLLKGKYHRLVYSSDFSDGGHFAAYEVPEIYAQDVLKAVAAMEAC